MHYKKGDLKRCQKDNYNLMALNKITQIHVGKFEYNSFIDKRIEIFCTKRLNLLFLITEQT